MWKHIRSIYELRYLSKKIKTFLVMTNEKKIKINCLAIKIK